MTNGWPDLPDINEDRIADLVEKIARLEHTIVERNKEIETLRAEIERLKVGKT